MSKNTKVIFHLDMDAFFASCLQMKYPQYKNKPIVVGINSKRSIITTSSYEARKKGVKTAMPIYKALELCPELIVVEPEYDLFTKTSQKIWELLFNRFTNKIEVASIDECYIDVTDIWKDYGTVKSLALKIQESIYQELDITCSIGISENKFFAKMGGKLQKPNGVTILTKNVFFEKMWNYPVREMFGVGIRTAQAFESLNIKTIKDLALSDDKFLKDNFGDNALKIKMNALGEGSNIIKLENNDLKSISNEVTLDFPTDDVKEIEDIIRQISAHVSERALRRRVKARTVAVILKYYKKYEVFDKVDHIKHNRKQVTLTDYTNSYEIIAANAISLFNDIYQSDKKILLIGVGIDNIKKENKIYDQLNFTHDDFYKKDNHEIKNIVRDLSSIKIMTGTEYEKTVDENKAQGKYLKNYDTHITNKKIRNNRKKTK
ncbi:Y-family DNA polymerase [Mesoplasma photuris]|uniref:Y-family DNA polymerase n=1 Tax=Mesoplasma photuris TaxID=217731 RepID=UPI00068F977B|nr:DNA polymerase IV [Mesoplasma photuris]